MAGNNMPVGRTARRGQGKPGKATHGAKSRLVAANLVGLVTGKRASLDDLCGEEHGFQPWLDLDPRDRALARAIALTTLRHRRQILAMLAQCWKRPPPAGAQLLSTALEIAMAQIAFMDIPDSAAVNIAVGLISSEQRTARFSAFANAVLRKAASRKEALLAGTGSTPAFPEWLHKRLQSDHGRDKLREMAAMFRREPHLDLNGKPGFHAAHEGAFRLPGQSIRIAQDIPPEQLPGYAEGDWWVQDLASAQPVKLLAACLEGGIAGRSIADLCAAPGGKTMQLAAMGARVTAVDVSARRLERLSGNLGRTRMAATIVCADILDWEPDTAFDAILLDAPCTATGTVRRHPDIAWNTAPGDIDTLAGLQRDMLLRASQWLKPGGILVYANCSLLKAEGEDLVSGLDLPGCEPVPFTTDMLPGLEECINGRGQFRSLLHFPLPDGNGSPDQRLPEKMRGMDGFFAAGFHKR